MCGSSLPVLQQVVAADVGLVADRDELRDADARARRPGHELDAEPARLRQERDVSGIGWRRRERRVHADSGRGVHDAEAVRSDDAHAVAARESHELALARRCPSSPTSANPAMMTTRPCTPFSAHSRDDVRRPRRGHDDDREVDRVGNVERRVGYARTPRDRCRRRVHRVDRTVEPVREQVAEQLVADRARSAARADHRDRTRREQPRHRRRLGVPFALLDRRDRARRRLDREAHVHRAVAKSSRCRRSNPRREHVRASVELPEACRPRTCGCRWRARRRRGVRAGPCRGRGPVGRRRP